MAKKESLGHLVIDLYQRTLDCLKYCSYIVKIGAAPFEVPSNIADKYDLPMSEQVVSVLFEYFQIVFRGKVKNLEKYENVFHSFFFRKTIPLRKKAIIIRCCYAQLSETSECIKQRNSV